MVWFTWPRGVLLTKHGRDKNHRNPNPYHFSSVVRASPRGCSAWLSWRPSVLFCSSCLESWFGVAVVTSVWLKSILSGYGFSLCELCRYYHFHWLAVCVIFLSSFSWLDVCSRSISLSSWLTVYVRFSLYRLLGLKFVKSVGDKTFTRLFVASNDR